MKNDQLTISSDDLYLFSKGEWYRSYDKLGAHLCVQDGKKGCSFCVWVPGARAVHVTGTFNDWALDECALEQTDTGGLWHGFVAGVKEGDLYKYVIDPADGERLFKADPYAFHAELPPGTASRVADLSGYKWTDKAWLDKRKASNMMKAPLNIYEVHLGSWKCHENGDYYTYDELAEELVPYVKKMGYSHVELLPVMEHPFDGSWGYQTTGYYAPTSRYGTPKQFMHLVNEFHRAGIGVILDWVPGGFCRDEHGLVHFNGNKLYEKEEHPNWGTFKFDYERGEVRTFLISNALYWLEQYHADGIRMDGVTSMLYLNFGIDDPRQKKFNSKGTEEDFVSIDFIRKTNETVGKYFPDVMMMAEESTAWPLVTYPPKDGGLGFHFKWDMGWMNDSLHYMQTDYPWRPGNHKLITFSIMYAFNENFILPLSHDEVVHGKCSLIGRMPGDYWRQFAGMRSLAFYQMTHPGAKLNFMGNEIAQFVEWRYYEGIQWFLTEEYEAHAHQQRFVEALNNFYLKEKALWENGYAWNGFEWIDADDSQQSIVSFLRHGDNPDDDLVILINFDPATYEQFRIGVPRPGIYQEVFNSDQTEFGGSGVLNVGSFKSEETGWNNREQSIVVRVPPLAGIVFKRTGDLPAKKTAARGKTTAPKKPTATKAVEKTPAAKAATKTAQKAPAAKPAAKKAPSAKSPSKPSAKPSAKRG